jgi:lipooligosaccharide transport system ATP-binding protein
VSEPLIVATGLRKSFPTKGGEFEAVRGIDVEVRRGEAFGFLGPNGAGKSSTMRMVAAVSPVTGGTLRILGMDPAVDGPAIRARIGVCPQEDTLDTELNVRDNLYIYGRYFGIPRAEVRERVDELLDFVQLTERADAKVDDLSGGMKRRLTIARSLVNRPEVLPDRILVYSDDGEHVLEQVYARGLHPIATLVRRSTLEDVFLRLTGRTLVD